MSKSKDVTEGAKPCSERFEDLKILRFENEQNLCNYLNCSFLRIRLLKHNINLLLVKFHIVLKEAILLAETRFSILAPAISILNTQYPILHS